MSTLVIVGLIVIIYLVSAAIAFKILDDGPNNLSNKWVWTWTVFGPFTLIVLAGIGIYALFDPDSRNARAMRKVRHQQNLERARNNP